MEWDQTVKLLEKLEQQLVNKQGNSAEIREVIKDLGAYRHMLLKTPLPETQRFSDLRSKLMCWYLDLVMDNKGGSSRRGRI